MQMGFTFPSVAFDILGEQLLLAYMFAQNCFSLKAKYHCAVQGEICLASDLFSHIGDKWFLRNVALPAIIEVKAIGVDKKNLLLETTVPDEELVREIIKDRGFPFLFQKYRKRIVKKDRSRKIICEMMYETLPKEENRVPRCLWRVDYVKCKDELPQIIEFLDAICTSDAYLSDERYEEYKSAQPAELKMQLSHDLNLLPSLLLEQYPSLSLRGRGYVRTSLELEQIQRLQYALERKTLEEKVEFIVRTIEEKGKQYMLNIVHFILAGKLKRTDRGRTLSYKECRKYAKKLIPTL